MSNYRAQLESERDELSRLLEGARPHDRRASDVTRLRKLIDEIESLDAGTHWTQPASDTKARIVLKDLQASVKVIKH